MLLNSTPDSGHPCTAKNHPLVVCIILIYMSVVPKVGNPGLNIGYIWGGQINWEIDINIYILLLLLLLLSHFSRV